MRSAEARKQEALARQEELKAQKAEKDLDEYGKVPEMDKFTKQVYDSNPQFAAAYNLAKAGKELTAQQQRVFNAGLKQIKELRGGGTERQQAGDVRITILGQKAPTIAKFINSKEDLKNFYVKYMLQSDSLGIPTNDEIIQFAKAIQDFITKNPKKRNEIKELKAVIATEPNVIARADGGKFLLSNIKEPEPEKDIDKKKRKKEVKAIAKKENKTFEEMLQILNKKALEFKFDTRVKIKVGKIYPKIYQVVGHDESTGTVKIKGEDELQAQKEGKKITAKLKYQLPQNLVPVVKQTEVDIDIPESFEQIVKRYR
jgi:hypothetical protein